MSDTASYGDLKASQLYDTDSGYVRERERERVDS